MTDEKQTKPVLSRIEKVRRPHKNIYTTSNLLPPGFEPFASLTVQGSDGGRIYSHDHKSEGQHEVLYLAPNTIYPGIKRDDNYCVLFPGHTHGDARTESKGQWLSVKIGGDAKYLLGEVAPRAAAFMFAPTQLELYGPIGLAVGVGETREGVEEALHNVREGVGGLNAIEQRLVWGLPYMEQLNQGQYYVPVQEDKWAPRYVGLEKLVNE